MAQITKEIGKKLESSAVTRPLLGLLRWAKRAGHESLAFFRSLRPIIFTVIPVMIKARARPVLFSRWKGAGDVICTFPAALQLKQKHSGRTFLYNCHPDFACLPKMAGVASAVISTDQRPLGKYWSFLFSAIYEFRWGEDHKNNYASDDFPIEAYCIQHGVKPVREHARIMVDEETSRQAEAVLKKFQVNPAGPLIMFHTGPTWPIREWPRDGWDRLVDSLRSAGFSNLVQLGASKNVFMGQVESEQFPNVITLVDKLDLRTTVGVIARAKLLIGIDSGLLHIAASVGTPFVGIWGPTTPQLRFSEKIEQYNVVSDTPCQGCHHRIPCLHWITDCEFGIRCMKGIRPDEVLSQCLKALKPSK